MHILCWGYLLSDQLSWRPDVIPAALLILARGSDRVSAVLFAEQDWIGVEIFEL